MTDAATGPPGPPGAQDLPPDLPEMARFLEFPYTRTTGPVMGPFLTGLRDGRILGRRWGDRVICPPPEHPPVPGEEPAEDLVSPTPGEPAEDLVEVGPEGTVGAWTWVTEPTRTHPFAHPFAFALIRLDGADVPFVHAVDAGSVDRMATGMRVSAQFRDERAGAITDLHFVPAADAVAQHVVPGDGPVTVSRHLISLEMREPLYPHRARYARGLLDGRLVGQRSPVTGTVNVPGRGYDQLEHVEMTEADDVVVADRGAVTSYTVITPIAYYGQEETEPYIRASILLDGTDAPLAGVDIRDIPVDAFRVGLRLRAVWRPPAERDVSGLDNRGFGSLDGVIARWEPTGEPDADPRLLQEHAS